MSIQFYSWLMNEHPSFDFDFKVDLATDGGKGCKNPDGRMHLPTLYSMVVMGEDRDDM